MSSLFRVACLALVLWSTPLAAFAQVAAIRSGVDAAATQSGLQTTGCSGTACIVSIIGNVVNTALSFMGVLLLLYILYAGFLWTTSGGESKKADAAKTMIQNAVIGLVLTLSAFAISSFVLTQVGSISSGGGGSDSAPAQTEAPAPAPQQGAPAPAPVPQQDPP